MKRIIISILFIITIIIAIILTNNKEEIQERLADLYPANETLRPILKLCADTILYGMQENFVDCPTREKQGWMNDAQASIEQTLINFDIMPFYNKWFVRTY